MLRLALSIGFIVIALASLLDPPRQPPADPVAYAIALTLAQWSVAAFAYVALTARRRQRIT